MLIARRGLGDSTSWYCSSWLLGPSARDGAGGIAACDPANDPATIVSGPAPLSPEPAVLAEPLPSSVNPTPAKKPRQTTVMLPDDTVGPDGGPGLYPGGQNPDAAAPTPALTWAMYLLGAGVLVGGSYMLWRVSQSKRGRR
jgi:hypothetical protein